MRTEFRFGESADIPDICGAGSSGDCGGIKIDGIPNARQKEFFSSTAKYTSYGGARGGGKSWALRRKLICLCLRYPGITCLIVRRSYAELRGNHLIPMLRELAPSGMVSYRETEKCLTFSNGSRIIMGYCSSSRDMLRYQGQEYDIIAIDEATQLREEQFDIFKGCLRGPRDYPRRIYLTCNPGGVGHAWVKRLFIDREFRSGETPCDYAFIPAKVWDNDALMRSDPGYADRLASLPSRLRDAWLHGRWDIFAGQFFPEFNPERHVCGSFDPPGGWRRFIAFDYGFDMLAALWMTVDFEGGLHVYRETAVPGLTLSEAAARIAAGCNGEIIEYAVASPDLWNRRQDSGRSGFEIMSGVAGMPPMIRADDRRIPGWRALREYLSRDGGLRICNECSELIRSLPALIFDAKRTEDASGEPHEITHAPEALRYAVMSRLQSTEINEFKFAKRNEFMNDGFPDYYN